MVTAAEETKGPNPNPTDAVEKPATVALETPKAAVEAGLNPGVLALSMKASESKTKSVNMHLPKDSVPPKADILFAFDLTGSMGDELANAKVNSQNIMNNLTDLVADINFGVVSFMDYPDYYESCDYYGSYGSEWSGDYPYSRDQALTDSTLSVKGAINGLTLGSGNDGPESYSRVLYETFADSSIGWRSGSKKIVIMWGDALPHDCDVYSCTGDSPAWWYYEGSTGADPGRDGVVDTADDLAIIDVMNGMAAEKITLIMLYSGGDWDETGAGLWDCLASMTGGQAFEINYDGTIPGGAEIPEYLANKIDDEIKVIDEFTMEVCEEDEATFSSWLSNVNPAVHGPINIGIAAADISFDLTISVPSTAVVDEVYEFDICALGDGVEYDRLPCQITIGDNVVVPPPTDPPSRSKKGCFSADATTQVMDRGEVPMKDLVLGDEVLVGNGFEPVYGFGHYNRSEVQSYLQLKAGGDCGTTLEMTDDHLLYVQKDNVVTAIAAGSVKPGDIVVTGDAKTCPITKITKTQKIGTFMPLTKSGNIVVNGKYIKSVSLYGV